MTPENEKSIRQLEKLTSDVDVCRKYVQLKDAVKIYGASATFISRRAKKAEAVALDDNSSERSLFNWYYDI